jgi:hypothetical protein
MKKRYENGGEVEDSTLGAMEKLREVQKSSRPLTFKEAFRQALDAGEKTFPWQGKTYTTELATEKTPRSSSPSSRFPSSPPPPSSSSASSQSHPEVPKVREIREAAAASGTGTDPTSRATEGASDTIEKALAATAGGGAARLLVRNLLKSVPARAIAGAVRKEPGLFKDAIAKGKPERTLGDYKRGGSVTRGDGIAKRGKTRGRYI